MAHRKIFAKVGNVYGRLTVIELLPAVKSHYKARCVCVCGKESVCNITSLASGRIQSCGCAKREKLQEKNFKHGMSGSRIYVNWKGMLARCENKNHSKYSNYGGRGISVCKEWHDFNAFYAWAIQAGYADGLQIDRIDNNGNYCPENCRWVSVKDNCRNRRSSKYITISNETKTLAEWAEIAGLSRGTIERRLKLGWSGGRLLLSARKGVV